MSPLRHPWGGGQRQSAKNAAISLPGVPADLRGGQAKKRGLSDEQGPILVAADRSGASVSAVSPAVTADAIRGVLAPVLDQDALLVTDGCPSYPPYAAAWGIGHEGLNQSDGERVRGEWHIQTGHNRHSRLEDFLRARRGAATKYPASCLRRFHPIALHSEPPTILPRRRHRGMSANTVYE